jgi:4'-phosphopantetheinyl transferase
MADASARVDVFIADADALGVSPASDNGLLDRLSAAERQQLTGLRSAKPYIQFLLSRALLRTALQAWGGAPAAAWRLRAELSGRPYLQADAAASLPAVSLSHSGSTVLCALAQTGDVGVDVEADRARDIDALAAEVLDQSELLALNGIEGALRRRMFFQLWTLKEACSKALGTGMATPFRELVFRLDLSQIGFTPAPTGLRAQFISFIPQPDTVAALALLSPQVSAPPSVRFHRMTAPDELEDANVTILARTLPVSSD